MKKVVVLALFFWACIVQGVAQIAHLVSNNQAIGPGEPAMIEFWYGQPGSVEPIDFTIWDKTTNSFIHEYDVTEIPYLFQVFPEQTTSYKLTYARNRYGEISLSEEEITIYVIESNNIVYFNPQDVCNNSDEIDLMTWFSSNIVPESVWFEGDGVVNTHFFRPTAVSSGSHAITAHAVINGHDKPVTSWFVVFDIPEVDIYGIPHEEIYISTEPFVLIGVPTGGIFYQDPEDLGLNGNTFNPAIAGPGNHCVYYKYTTGNDCQETVQKIIHVSYGNVVVEQINMQPFVYPNPTTGILNISPDELNNVNRIEIYSIVGLKIGIFEKSDQINLSGWPAGTYILSLDVENKKIRIPIVKY